MSAMVVPAMHQDGMQRVFGRRRLRLLQKLGQINILIKLVAIVDFNIRVRLWVVLESHQMQVEHGRKLLKEHAFLRLLQPVFARVIFILAIQRLHAYVVFE